MKPCTVDGCEKPQDARGLCPMHYYRYRRTGEVGPAESVIAERGTGSVMANGYRVITRPGHPLAGAQDKVYEHRFVLFETIGAGDHPCHWCGLTLRWDHIWPEDADALTVDHVDEDTLNNEPENLVPACNECNTQRKRRADVEAVA